MYLRNTQTRFFFHFLALTILATLILHNVAGNDIVVTTSVGKVKGIPGRTAFTASSFYQFRGIPYAKPPLGELRFESPEPAEPWDGIRDGSNYSAPCLQVNYETAEVEGDEDCLYLNVYTHDYVQKSSLKSVIVLFHGGSFQFEHGGHYSPDHMLEEDIVLVTFNFRLGALGFLSSGADGIISGNFGLKDQVLALKWVRDNIKFFNGNPDDVTILGFSSGGASVHLQMLSPLSEGLFHKAISQSGTALMPWVLTRNPERRVKKIADLMECSDEDMTKVKQCLVKADAKQITDKQGAFAEWYIDPIVAIGPVVEKASDSAFLSKFPHEAITDGNFHSKKIPWLLGVNSHEGLLHAGDIVNNGMLIRVINTEWAKAAPITLILRHATFDALRTSDAIKGFYFGDPFTIDNSTLDSLINMYSDRYFYHGTRTAAKLHLENGAEAPIYLYYFDQQGPSSIIHLTNERNKNLAGVAHYDQLQYLFPTSDFAPLSPELEDFALKFVGIICQFAKTGSINGWTASTVDDFQSERAPQYNVIGTVDGTIPEPFTQRLQFWDSLGLMEGSRELGGDFINSLVTHAEKEAKEDVKDRIEL